MFFVMMENFTHNEMIIEGKDAIKFYRSFQHIMHEPVIFNIENSKKIEYVFKYLGEPKHDYLIMAKKDFPLIKFEIKGFYYPNDTIYGCEEIFLCNNKGIYKSTAKDAGFDDESNDVTYEEFFEMAKKKINENKSTITFE